MAPVLKLPEIEMESYSRSASAETVTPAPAAASPFPRPANIMMLMLLALKGAMDVQSESQSVSALRMQSSQIILSDNSKEYKLMAEKAQSASSKAMGGAGYWGVAIGCALVGALLGAALGPVGWGLALGVGMALLLGGGFVLVTQIGQKSHPESTPDFFTTKEIDQSITISIQMLSAALGAIGDVQNNESQLASKSLSGAADINQALAQYANQMIQSLANVMKSYKQS